MNFIPTDFNQFALLLLKFFFVLGAVIYFIFASVVVKQSITMSKNVNDKFNSIIIIFSWIHLAFSGFLIFLTLTVL